MRCCEKCFDDTILKEYIRRHGRPGVCGFCSARSHFAIEAGDLESMFTRFTEAYRPVEVGGNVPPDVNAYEVGDQLATLIQDQWGIFSERLTKSGRQHDLLRRIYTANRREDEILEAPPVEDLWTDRDWLHTTLLQRWRELADELKYPEQHSPIATGLDPPPEDEFAADDSLRWFGDDLGRAIITVPAGSRIYRVRLGYREEDYHLVPIPPDDMGAPPSDKATAARANAAGVSYLYCAEDEQTAVAEKRPHRGLVATIGAGETLRDSRLIDLTAGIGIASPFEATEGCLGSLMESCDLFDHLNTEFAKPLRRTDDTHEYLPTQFFADWAKGQGYDGLRYESAMLEGGRNVVFFDIEAAVIKTTRLVRADAVEVVYSDYSGEDD